MYVFRRELEERKKKASEWRDSSISWRRYSSDWNAYSLAGVNISSYAVLITWPRYNNMDYSYPRFPAWCDASWGERVSKFTGLHKACGIRNPMLRRFHAEMLPQNHHKVSDSIMLPWLCVHAHVPWRQIKRHNSLSIHGFQWDFLRNFSLLLEVITWEQKKRKETHMRSGLKATGHSHTT